jgi:hypothetical protein
MVLYRVTAYLSGHDHNLPVKINNFIQIDSLL